MKATLKSFTALALILALTPAAGAGMNNMPIPQIIRPVITPPVDVRHLAPKPERRDRKSVKQRERNRQQRSTRASGGKRQMSKAADRAGLREAMARKRLLLPKHPPLPQSKPDFAALNDNPREAGPQPEPPTIERLRGRVGDLALLEEHGNARDLKETLEGNRALDESGIGGGSGGERHGPSGFDWREMVPEGNTEAQGPQNDQVWKAGLPGASAYGRGLDREQGFTPHWKSQSGERNHSGFGRTPGRAGGNLKGQRGWNMDGTSCGWNCVTESHTAPDGADYSTYKSTSYWHRGRRNREDDGDLTNGAEGHGRMHTETIVRYNDGSTSTYSTWGRWDENDNWDVLSNEQVAHTPPPGTPPSDMTFTLEEAEGGDGPDSQPAPDQPASGESMPCPKTSRGCGPSGGLLSYKPSKGDKVSQPGKGEDQGIELGFKASVAERKGVVTNPVDPANYVRTGGGRGPRPIQHVTQPGGPGPDRPGT